MIPRYLLILASALVAFLVAPPAHADRVKDLASLAAARSNQLVGFGIVVGLQNYLANIGSWSTIATGFIFVICVLAFRRGVVGEITAHLKNKK